MANGTPWRSGKEAFLQAAKSGGRGGGGFTPYLKLIEGDTRLIFLCDLEEEHDGFQKMLVYEQYQIESEGQFGRWYLKNDEDEFHPEYVPGETKEKTMVITYVFNLDAYEGLVLNNTSRQMARAYANSKLSEEENFNGVQIWDMGPQVQTDLSIYINNQSEEAQLNNEEVSMLDHWFVARRKGQRLNTTYSVHAQGLTSDLMTDELAEHIEQVKGDLRPLSEILDKRRYKPGDEKAGSFSRTEFDDPPPQRQQQKQGGGRRPNPFARRGNQPQGQGSEDGPYNFDEPGFQKASG